MCAGGRGRRQQDHGGCDHRQLLQRDLSLIHFSGTFTDVLDPNLQYTSFTVGRNTVDGVLSKAPVTLAQSGQTLTFTIGDASDPAKYFLDGESMDIVVNAKVIAVPTNAGRTIDNSASIASPGLSTDTDGPRTIVVNPEAAAVYDWTLTKSKTAPSGCLLYTSRCV